MLQRIISITIIKRISTRNEIIFLVKQMQQKKKTRKSFSRKNHFHRHPRLLHQHLTKKKKQGNITKKRKEKKMWMSSPSPKQIRLLSLIHPKAKTTTLQQHLHRLHLRQHQQVPSPPRKYFPSFVKLAAAAARAVVLG